MKTPDIQISPVSIRLIRKAFELGKYDLHQDQFEEWIVAQINHYNQERKKEVKN